MATSLFPLLLAKARQLGLLDPASRVIVVVIQLLFLISLLLVMPLQLSIILINRPKFLVPKSMRHERGVISRLLESRKKGSASRSERS